MIVLVSGDAIWWAFGMKLRTGRNQIRDVTLLHVLFGTALTPTEIEILGSRWVGLPEVRRGRQNSRHSMNS